MQSREPGNLVKEQPPLFHAAEYVRMSTEHQRYSTQNQAHKIREYAATRGIQIVRTYADEGKSGLGIDGRPALQQLIRDVEGGNAEFEIILVYDVSRWGRFQDADESAYYEYRCRRAGIRVAYCAEPFENDGSPLSTIVKSIKRAMAGEYSRELSGKVFAGQCRLVELGYSMGGQPGYGLRRILVDQNGAFKSEMGLGDRKVLQSDRVILMPGPRHEVRIVQLIYSWFIEDGLKESEIAHRLNKMSVQSEYGLDWNRHTVTNILKKEKYIGNNVFNRTSGKLNTQRVKNTPDMWIRKDGAFEAIVSPEVFYKAQSIIQARAHNRTDEDLIEGLRALYKKKGRLSSWIIDEAEDLPSAAVYNHRFGSLVRAYEMVGFHTNHDCRFLESNRFLRRYYPEIVEKTVRTIENRGAVIRRDPATDLLTINDEFTASLVLVKCQAKNGYKYWTIRFDANLAPDITVAIRLDQDNRNPQEYYLLPRLDFRQRYMNISDHNQAKYKSYRFDNLEFFFSMTERAQLRTLQDSYESSGQPLEHEREGETSPDPENIPSAKRIRTSKKEVQRQNLVVKKSKIAQQHLLFIIGALRQLFTDENFNNLLRAEGMETLPKYLVEHLRPGAPAICAPQKLMTKIEREIRNLKEPYKMVEQNYGLDILHLVLARGYLSKLVDNTTASRYLEQRHPEILKEFQCIIQIVSTDQ